MLNQNHLEQHHRIDTGAPVIFTIEGLYQFIQHLEIYSCVYLSKQMLLGTRLSVSTISTIPRSSFPRSSIFITQFYFTIQMRKSPAETGLFRDICTQEPRSVPSSADDGIKSNCVFSGDKCLGKNTSQSVSVRAERVCVTDCILSKKCLHF